MFKTRRPLGCLGSYANVHGEEAVGRRVGAERTHVERQTIDMYQRGEETWRPLTRQRVAAFIRLFLMCAVYAENGHRRGRPHPITSRLLKKALIHRVIPLIDRRLVWSLDETMWPITMEQFKELNHHLEAKLPTIHAGQHWQNILYFFKEVERKREEQRREAFEARQREIRLSQVRRVLFL